MKKIITVLLACAYTCAYGGGRRPQFPTLIRGNEARPADFPASVSILFSNSQGTFGCTATLVGPRAVLLAAHCVGSNTKFSIGPTQYTATCASAREYQTGETADYGICYTQDPIEGIPYEKVNMDPNLIKVGAKVLLTGYGCTIPDPSGQGNGSGTDGKYRIGYATVSRVPSGSNNDIITRAGSALCSGDSGGPAFLINESTGDRVVVAVNSRGDINTTSYLSATHTRTFQDFIGRAKAKFNLEICGIDAGVKGCRGSHSDPGNPDEPNDPGEPLDPNDPIIPNDPNDPNEPNDPFDPTPPGGQAQFTVNRPWITVSAKLKPGFDGLSRSFQAALTRFIDTFSP